MSKDDSKKYSMPDLVPVSIPTGSERDAFFRRVAESKTADEARGVLEQVRKLYEPDIPDEKKAARPN